MYTGRLQLLSTCKSLLTRRKWRHPNSHIQAYIDIKKTMKIKLDCPFEKNYTQRFFDKKYLQI